MLSTMNDALIELQSLLGEGSVRTDAEALGIYGKDWTSGYAPRPSAVAFPAHAEAVQNLVRWARKHRRALVPSGGRTGLSAGAVAAQGEVVVSTERLNRILLLSRADRTLTCESGVITQRAQEHARDNGFYFPVDFASRGSSQLGGNVATNAGGVRVVRYGTFREWVAGLKFVSGAGDLIDANRNLIKNATGYDFRHLLIGSEGTLGIVTEVTLKLTSPPGQTQTLLFALNTLDRMMPLYEELRDRLPLLAFEVFTEGALQHVLRQRSQSGRPAQHPFSESGELYVLAEVDQGEDAHTAPLEALIENTLERGWITDGIASQNERQSRELWSYREEISEALSRHTPFKCDLAVRVSRVPAFVEELRNTLRKTYPSFEIVWFGHLGDGNLHINVLKPADWERERFFDECRALSHALYALVQKHEGSVSAEHGIGLVKRDALPYSRSGAEIELMRGIKKAFDPDCVLNPGKIFSLEPV